MPPTPPLTADELLELWSIYAQSEIMAQLRIDHADDFERRALDRSSVYRWKASFKREEWRP